MGFRALEPQKTSSEQARDKEEATLNPIAGNREPSPFNYFTPFNEQPAEGFVWPHSLTYIFKTSTGAQLFRAFSFLLFQLSLSPFP